MSSQQFAQPRREVQQQEIADIPQVNKQSFSVDSILDEIDTVLETNASSFVQGFVQKGGQ